ncbi:MAG: four helix bundle protein [Candidatus Manganitrophus sp.]|nr:MAG: four helix bundle protein [Candidatus Manganitrophus sp.]
MLEKPHKKLDAWKLSVDLVTHLYKVTASFPKDEQYGLTNQIRRAAVSIPSNIAEGAARQTKKEFVNYLHIAQGSLSELDTQLEIAKQLVYLDPDQWKSLDEKMDRVDKMISGLIRRNISKIQK